MASETLPASGQMVFPEYPDVGYRRWQNLYGHSSSRLGAAINAWALGNPNYSTWRQNQLDSYNAAVGAYNAWASSPQGHAAQNTAAGYNMSYDSGATSQGSPLSYQDVNPGNGFSEMAQGISGIIQFAQAVAGIKSMAVDIASKAAGIRGQELKNEAQEIQNKYLERTLRFRSMNFGYQADWNRMRNQAQIYSQFAGRKGVFGLNGMYTPTLGDERLEYFMDGTEKGFLYNRQNADLAFLRAGTSLRNQQKALGELSGKAQKFYIENLLPLQQQILSGQKSLQEVELKWSDIEHELRKKALNWQIGLQATNTVISAIKTGLSLMNPAVGAMDAMGNYPMWNPSPSWSTPWQYPYGVAE